MLYYTVATGNVIGPKLVLVFTVLVYLFLGGTVPWVLIWDLVSNAGYCWGIPQHTATLCKQFVPCGQ